MSTVNVGMTPHQLFAPTNSPDTSDWFYVCKDPSTLPPTINGGIPVFPFGCVVVSVPNTDGQYDANELYLETLSGVAPGNGRPVRFSGSFTCMSVESVGFYRVQKGGSSVPTGAEIQAFGTASEANE